MLTSENVFVVHHVEAPYGLSPSYRISFVKSLTWSHSALVHFISFLHVSACTCRTTGCAFAIHLWKSNRSFFNHAPRGAGPRNWLARIAPYRARFLMLRCRCHGLEWHGLLCNCSETHGYTYYVVLWHLVTHMFGDLVRKVRCAQTTRVRWSTVGVAWAGRRRWVRAPVVKTPTIAH